MDVILIQGDAMPTSSEMLDTLQNLKTADDFVTNRAQLDLLEYRNQRALAIKYVRDCSTSSELSLLNRSIAPLQSIASKGKETFYSLISRAIHFKIELLNLADPNCSKPYQFFTDVDVDTLNEFEPLADNFFNTNTMPLVERLAFTTPVKMRNTVCKSPLFNISGNFASKLRSAYELKVDLEQLIHNPLPFLSNLSAKQAQCWEFSGLCIKVLEANKAVITKTLTQLNQAEQSRVLSQINGMKTIQDDSRHPFELIKNILENKQKKPTLKSSIFFDSPCTDSSEQQVKSQEPCTVYIP